MNEAELALDVELELEEELEAEDVELDEAELVELDEAEDVLELLLELVEEYEERLSVIELVDEL